MKPLEVYIEFHDDRDVVPTHCECRMFVVPAVGDFIQIPGNPGGGVTLTVDKQYFATEAIVEKRSFGLPFSEDNTADVDIFCRVSWQPYTPFDHKGAV